MFWNKDKELIEYAEQEAKILAKFQMEYIESMDKASNHLLNILLGGAGGSLALLLSMYSNGAEAWVLSGIVCTSAYLFLLCALVSWKCLWVKDLYPLANEPKKIYNDKTKKYNLIKIKRLNLDVRQHCLDSNRRRYDGVGYWLNLIRVLAAITPIVLIIGCVAAFYFSGME